MDITEFRRIIGFGLLRDLKVHISIISFCELSLDISFLGKASRSSCWAYVYEFVKNL